jgi:hypothetical protein
VIIHIHDYRFFDWHLWNRQESLLFHLQESLLFHLQESLLYSTRLQTVISRVREARSQRSLKKRVLRISICPVDLDISKTLIVTVWSYLTGILAVISPASWLLYDKKKQAFLPVPLLSCFTFNLHKLSPETFTWLKAL